MEYLACDGEIDLTDLTCSTDWTVLNTAQSFDPSTLDPVLIAGAVGTGFFILVPLWAACFGVRYLINAIR